MDALCILLVLVCILTILYYYLTWTFDYWKNQGVTTIFNAVPLFGDVKSVLLLRESLASVCNRAYERSPRDSSMVGLYMMRTPVLVIREPELIKSILIKDFQSFHDNLMVLSDKRDPFLSKNPFFAGGEVWKTQRVNLISNMSLRKLKMLFQILHKVSLQFEEYLDTQIANDDVLDLGLTDVIPKFTSELVANTAFGIHGCSFNDDVIPGSFLSMVNQVFEPTTANSFRVVLNYYLPKLAALLNLGFVAHEVNKYLMNTVANVVRYRRENNIVVEDLLQMVMDTVTESENTDVIAGHVSSFFFDAFDTNAGVAAFAICELSNCPNVQEIAVQQIEDVLEKYGGELCFEALKELSYLDQIILETVRLHPILGINIKRCNQRISLEGSDGQKCVLKPGHFACIPVVGLHTDEKYWPDPLNFDPERFSEERKNEVTKFVFLPFGEGPRMCAGMKYAIMTVKTILVTILKNYYIEKSPNMTFPLIMEQNSNLTAAKGGLWARLKRR